MDKKEKQKKNRIRKTMCKIRDRIEKLKLMKKKFTKKSKAKAKNKSTRRIRRNKQQKGGVLPEKFINLHSDSNNVVTVKNLVIYDKLIKKKNKETEELIEKQKKELEEKFNKLKQSIPTTVESQLSEESIKTIIKNQNEQNTVIKTKVEEVMKEIEDNKTKAEGKIQEKTTSFQKKISELNNNLDTSKNTIIPAINQAIIGMNKKLREITNSNIKNNFTTTQFVVSEKVKSNNSDVDGLTLADSSVDGLTLADSSVDGLTLADSSVDGLTLADSSDEEDNMMRYIYRDKDSLKKARRSGKVWGRGSDDDLRLWPMSGLRGSDDDDDGKIDR
jgi:hypothetical protein